MPDFELQNFLPYLLNQAAESSSMAFRTYYRDKYGMLRRSEEHTSELQSR